MRKLGGLEVDEAGKSICLWNYLAEARPPIQPAQASGLFDDLEEIAWFFLVLFERQTEELL